LNFRGAARFIAKTTAAAAAAMLLPVTWILLNGGGGMSAMVCSFVCASVMSALLFMAGRGADLDEMNSRDAILSVAGAWCAVSAAAGLPYLFSGVLPGFTDALFEGVSGFTTTGATVIRDLAAVPRGILLWRGISQWLGGIGIVVIAIAVFPSSGAGTQLFNAEVAGPARERITPRIRQTAVFLCKTYLALTGSQIFLLFLAGLGPFDALTLSFSSVATGGFSPYPDNLGHFTSAPVRAVTALFLFLSASSLTFFHVVVTKKNLSCLRDNPEMKFYVRLTLMFGAALSCVLFFGGVFKSFREAAAEGFFHAISMLSTCGFFTAGFNEWPAAARMLTLLMMFCGGCAVSSAGGISCSRIQIVLRHIAAEFSRRINPRAVVPTRLGSSEVETPSVSAAFAFFAAYICVFCAGFLLVTLFGLDMTSAISGVAATLGNVGPAFGAAGPSAGYAGLASPIKIVYIFLMLCGRLEIFTLLVLFSPRFWKG
jgi:trk system potassium uptake protein TrkH